MLLATVDYTLVIVTVITAVPATIAALAAVLNRRSLKTPSSTAIGKQVEQALQTSIANNYRLQAIGKEFDVPMPDKASEQEVHVDALNTTHTRAEREERDRG